MTQYLLSVYQPEGELADADLEKIMRDFAPRPFAWADSLRS